MSRIFTVFVLELVLPSLIRKYQSLINRVISDDLFIDQSILLLQEGKSQTEGGIKLSQMTIFGMG